MDESDTSSLPLLLLAVSVGLLAALVPGDVLAQERYVLQAHPVDVPIDVDGRLDEAAWQQAEAVTGFLQHEPDEGEPATQPTEVRVLYGPGHVYVGALLYDENPDGIRATLGRRDDVNQADWFIASFDSYFDQRTAYTFAVNAAGVQFDGLRAEGVGGFGGGIRGVDESWDAVWASDVRVTPEGWTVEMRIPYSMLRFSEEDVQTWGVHFTRRIPRLGEESEWPFVPRTERENLVAQYGRLEGLRGIEPRRNVQVIPYTVSRLHTAEGDEAGTLARDGSVDVGADFKLGIGSGITLDATVNPDFGQVESDPAVLNLTAFETFYEERRPFFVEGAQIYAFDVGRGELLYTRRIGAKAPIVGAAKLSGRTAGGTSFGVLGATTGHALTPERHYGVARVSQQIGAYSSAGGALTFFDAPTFEAARRRSLAGGADWDLRLGGNRYGLEGFTAFTHQRHPSAGNETGFAGQVWARKRQGIWTGALGFDVFDDQFDPNDVGQMRANNYVRTLLFVGHDINGGRAFGPFQRAGARGFMTQGFSYGELLDLGFSVNVGSRWTLRSFQSLGFGFDVENPFGGGYDLYETRGLGPWAQPMRFTVDGEFATDERRQWTVEPQVRLGFEEGGGRTYDAGVRGRWDVGSRLSLSGDLALEWEAGTVAWTANETFRRTAGGWAVGAESGPPDELGPSDYAAFADQGLLEAALEGVRPHDAEGRHFFVPVFGARDTRAVDLTLRSSFTFRPDLSLQFYGQLFVARGRYDDFQILRDRDTLVPFDAYPKRDEFAFSSFTANTVLRWEYLPGSVLYLVWTQGRRERDRLNPLAPWDVSPYEVPVSDQFADAFGVFPENVFLVKLSYTFLQ